MVSHVGSQLLSMGWSKVQWCGFQTRHYQGKTLYIQWRMKTPWLIFTLNISISSNDSSKLYLGKQYVGGNSNVVCQITSQEVIRPQQKETIYCLCQKEGNVQSIQLSQVSATVLLKQKLILLYHVKGQHLKWTEYLVMYHITEFQWSFRCWTSKRRGIIQHKTQHNHSFHSFYR